MTGSSDDRTKAGRPPAEWDAASYHRLSGPQFSWGRQVLERLSLNGDETVLDAGCGTGRLTAGLLERLPRGRVVAVDLSQNMLAEARSHLSPRFGGRVEFVRADLAALPFDEAFDGVFSTAAFHWVPDHPALFRSLFRSLRAGGWLVAQCGGGPNIARLMRRASVLTATEPYAPYFSGWKDAKVFADEVTTAERLRAAGFTDVATGLEPAPTRLDGADEFREFLTTVNMHAHLARLPEGPLRRQFVEELTEQAAADDPPFMLDYCRLNIHARRPGGASR
ncbi:MAG TPA: methyltransferase domain-containing protein [Pyrinomonadaceae bacterium]|jgi:trans-aconitate methyltransferase